MWPSDAIGIGPDNPRALPYGRSRASSSCSSSSACLSTPYASGRRAAASRGSRRRWSRRFSRFLLSASPAPSLSEYPSLSFDHHCDRARAPARAAVSRSSGPLLDGQSLNQLGLRLSLLSVVLPASPVTRHHSISSSLVTRSYTSKRPETLGFLFCFYVFCYNFRVIQSVLRQLGARLGRRPSPGEKPHTRF